MAELSIVIPAHNEEQVIARTLATLLEGARPGEVEVAVVCNGCTDRTLEIARGLDLAGVTVVTVDEPSKSAALNAGDKLVDAYPRFYLDADIPIVLPELRAMAARLRAGDVLAVSASTRHVVRTRSPLVRSYYALWTRLPAARTGLAGTGVIAMSETGRARFGSWPALLGDDRYADSLFEPAEKTRHGDGIVELPTPASFAALVRRRARVTNGNVQGRAAGVRAPAGPGQVSSLRALLRTSPSLLRHLPAFLVVTASARLLAYVDRRRGLAELWRRDDSRAQGRDAA